MRMFIHLTIITVLLIGGILAWFGYFTTPETGEETTGPYLLVYSKHLGDYKNSANLMAEFYSEMQDQHGMQPKKGFGLYYDDPETVAPEQLRSLLGCIVSQEELARHPTLNTAYTVREFPRSAAVVARFPYRGKLSIIAGMIRTYPVLKEWRQKLGWQDMPVLEIYDMEQGVIFYVLAGGLDDSFWNFLLVIGE